MILPLLLQVVQAAQMELGELFQASYLILSGAKISVELAKKGRFPEPVF